MQPQTTIRRYTSRIFSLLLAVPLTGAAQTAAAAAFAAPAQLTAPSTGFGVIRMVLALALVLAAVYAAAAALRRLRTLGPAGSAELQVISQVALGARERAVLLRAGSQQLLIGVAPGNVRLLCALADSVTPAVETTAAPAKPNFRDLLRRSLGR